MSNDLPQPPQVAQRILSLALMPRDRQTVVGDLLEEFRERVARDYSRRAAALWYWKQVRSVAWVLLLPATLLLMAAVAARWLSVVSQSRPDALPTVLLAIAAGYFLAGKWAGWLTRRLRAVTVMVVTFAIVAALINAAAMLVHVLLLRSYPIPPLSMRIHGGYFALVMFPGFSIGLLIAMAGGAVGRLWSSSEARDRVRN